jgi:MFS family permease
VVVPASAWLGARFGLKRVHVWALVLFTAASMLCAVAGSLDSLILFRIVQAIPGGIMPVLCQTILYRIVPSERLGAAMGLYGLGIVVGRHGPGHDADQRAILASARGHRRRQRHQHPRAAVSGALGLAVVTALVTADRAQFWTDRSALLQGSGANADQHIIDMQQQGQSGLISLWQQLSNQVQTQAYSNAFLLVGIVAIAGSTLAFFLPSKRPGGGGSGAAAMH